MVSVLLILSGCKEKSTIISEKVIEQEGYSKSIETKKITYLSDGLEVVGYLVKPISIEEQLPVIIYNRGGNREFGKISDEQATKLLEYLASGNYVVLASQYRGNDGGEGKEEFGGSDLNDVFNLINIVKDLPYVNPDQIFMIGASRGGMMTYMATRNSSDIKAAAVIGGVSDLVQVYTERLDMRSMLKSLIGGTPEELEDEYIKRSAFYWADEINVPIIILHGSDDWRVKQSQAQKIANELDKHGKEYKLIIYPGDDHSLSNNAEQMYEEIFEWFETYK